MKLPIKRWIILTHRWLGVGGCVLFFMWFLSGMVMIYVGYPQLHWAERLAHLPVLSADTPILSPREALSRAGVTDDVVSLSLAAARGGQPTYIVTALEPPSSSAESAPAEPTPAEPTPLRPEPATGTADAQNTEHASDARPASGAANTPGADPSAEPDADPSAEPSTDTTASADTPQAVVGAATSGTANAPPQATGPSTEETHLEEVQILIDARSGERLADASRATIMASARAYAEANVDAEAVRPTEASPDKGPDDGSRENSVDITHDGLVQEDALTHSHRLDPHRPLHRVQLDDAAGTRLYLSSLIGEVVLDAPRAERALNYVGAWLHWLYMFRGGALDAQWANLMLLLSGAGMVLAITGLIDGILRWRFRGVHRNGSHSPFPAGMMRWHHMLGLGFAFTTFTSVFSGFMSMDPGEIYDSGADYLPALSPDAEYIDLSAQDASVPALLQAAGRPVRELRWQPVPGGQTLVVATSADTARAVLDARTAQPARPDEQQLVTALQQLMPGQFERIEHLTADDFHYYHRAPHTHPGSERRPLPAWRAVYRDPLATWLVIDPATGEILEQLDSHSRRERWLFNLLHSWDWLPLITRRPLWDMLMLTLCLGGLTLSFTGIVIGWRRIRYKVHRLRHPLPGPIASASVASAPEQRR